MGLELPPGVFLQLDALVLPPSPSNHPPLPSNLQETEVGSPAPVLRSMHVQSLSEWAPANIGPYSQAFCVSQFNLFFVVFFVAEVDHCL